MESSTTLLRTAALVVLVSGCGRLNFAEVADDGSADAMSGAGRSL